VAPGLCGAARNGRALNAVATDPRVPGRWIGKQPEPRPETESNAFSREPTKPRRPASPDNPASPTSFPGGSSGLSADAPNAPGRERLPRRQAWQSYGLDDERAGQKRFLGRALEAGAATHPNGEKRWTVTPPRSSRSYISQRPPSYSSSSPLVSCRETRTGHDRLSQPRRSRTGTRLSLGTPCTRTPPGLRGAAADSHAEEGAGAPTKPRRVAGPASRTLFAETLSSRARGALTWFGPRPGFWHTGPADSEYSVSDDAAGPQSRSTSHQACRRGATRRRTEAGREKRLGRERLRHPLNDPATQSLP
jgi:hypothetical protein